MVCVCARARVHVCVHSGCTHRALLSYINAMLRDCSASCHCSRWSKAHGCCHTHWCIKTNIHTRAHTHTHTTKCGHRSTNQTEKWQLHCQQMDLFHQSYWLCIFNLRMWKKDLYLTQFHAGGGGQSRCRLATNTLIPTWNWQFVYWKNPVQFMHLCLFIS